MGTVYQVEEIHEKKNTKQITLIYQRIATLVITYFTIYNRFDTRVSENLNMVHPIAPKMSTPTAFARKIYNPLGFAKAYNFWLWFIFGGALTGCTFLNIYFFSTNTCHLNINILT